MFDPSVLERLASQARLHGDGGLVRELVHDALVSIAHCATELELAARASDLARLRAHAHRIKSVIRQVGAARMGHEAERVETLAAANDLGAVRHADVVLGLRHETERAIHEHLGRLA